MKEATVGKIRRSLRRFEDFAGDLARSDMNTFEDRLNLLLDYCKNDQIFSIIHEQLMKVPNVNIDKWYEEASSTVRGMVGSGDLIFPTNLDERMSIMYQLLWKINTNEIDFGSFSSNFFATGDSRIDSDIYAFNEAIVEPLSRELSYRIQDMEEELPEDNKDTYPLANIQIIHNANNVIQQSAVGNNIDQSATIKEHDKLIELFKDLRHELHEVIKDKKELEEALHIVQTSEELSNKGSSSVSSLKVLLGSLGALGNVGSITSAIISIISNMG